MYNMAINSNKTVKFMLGESLTDVIPCTDYGKGCLGTHRVMVNKVVLIAIEFDIEENAKKAATKLGGYYFKNWVFDDVAGEPILVEFVQKAFNAVQPKIKNKNKN